MFSHNPTSRAWEQLAALTDLPFDETSIRYGVTRLNPASPAERLLTANGYILKFVLGDGEINVSVLNDSIPLRQLPKARAFEIRGDVDRPLLLEHANELEEVSEVIADLTSEFREFSYSRRN